MSDRAPKKVSYDDLRALPSEVIGEILGGQLYTQPRPSNLHTLVTSVLGMKLGPPFQWGEGGPGGWFIIDRPEIHLGDDVVVPDMAGWRKQRLAQIPDENHYGLAPDWVCEVMSPGTAKRDRTVKLEIYRRESVGYYWLVDARLKTVEVLKLDGDGYRILKVVSGEETVRAEPFEAIEIELSRLWESIGGPAAPG